MQPLDEDTEYTIVPATRAHIAAVPGIEQAAAAMFPEEDLPLALRFLVTDEGSLHNAVRNGEIWVALHRDELPVGFAMATILDGTAHLDEMDVMPQHCRRGVGRRLALTVIEWARTQGYRDITLVTFRHLPWNGPFYQALGFETVDSAEYGPQILDQLEAERAAGIDIGNRVVMRKRLR